MRCNTFLCFVSLALLSNSLAWIPSHRHSLNRQMRLEAYVPSGLTEEEYQELKRKEREANEKKDFGAWGPKFARSSRPKGDWLLQPTLWTKGFSGQDDKKVPRMIFQGSVGNRLSRIFLSLLLVWNLSCPLLLLWGKQAGINNAYLMLAKKRAAAAALALGLSLSPVFYVISRNLLERSNRRLLWSSRRTLSVSSLCTALWSIIVIVITRHL